MIEPNATGERSATRRRSVWLASIVALGCAGATQASGGTTPALDDGRQARLDATCFFQQLIDRYRGLSAYEDVAKVSHVITREGQAPRRAETRIGCGIKDGELTVRTSRSIVWRSMSRLFGLDTVVPPRTRAKKDDADVARDYSLWLAPHMTLRFAENPLQEFRSGVSEGFTPTVVDRVTIGDRDLVHLELTSGDGLSGSANAKFDLYVNPDSMLVERISGAQRLADGASYETTLDITPTRAETESTDVEYETIGAPLEDEPPIESPPPFVAPPGQAGATPPGG